MDLVVLNEQEITYALRGFRDVVASNGTITPAERRFIEVVAELHGTKVDVDTLPSIAPGEVAEVITSLISASESCSSRRSPPWWKGT